MSSLEEYKHKYVYELTLKIVGDSVVHVDDPEIADQIAINEFLSCDLGIDEGREIDS